MEEIKELSYLAYYDYETKTVYILEPVKTKSLELIRRWLIKNQYFFRNIIIGKPDIW